MDLDREKARTLGVPINDVFATLSASMGGAYVNDFNRFGRLYRVYVQAEPAFRQKPEDIGQFYVRSTTTGEMIPLSTLMTVKPASGTEITVRFNLFRSVEITGVSGTRLHLRPGDEGARGGVGPGAAPRDGIRLLRLLLPGEAGPAGGADLRPRDHLRVPAPRGALRELEAALGGAAGDPARGPGRLLRGVARGLRQQRVRAGRLDHAGRSRGQERDPDRGVRQGASTKRACRSRTPRSRRPGSGSARS